MNMDNISSYIKSKQSIICACILSEFVTTGSIDNVVDDPIASVCRSVSSGAFRGFWLSMICPREINVYVVSIIAGITVFKVCKKLSNIAAQRIKTTPNNPDPVIGGIDTQTINVVKQNL